MYDISHFLNSNTIFKNVNVLKDNYIPDEFLFRDKERERIIKEIGCYFHIGVKPNDIFIYGPPGTGKTHMILKIIREINDYVERTGHKYRMIYTNFKNVTMRQGLANIIRLNLGRAGYTHMEIIRMIDKKIRGCMTTLVLDEIDKMIPTPTYENPIDTLIGTFTKLHETTGNDNVSIIAISNKYIMDSLTEPTASTFCPIVIYFREYKPDEIYKILSRRCEEAFVEGAIDDSALSYLVSLLGRKARDLRLALRTLLQAGKIAYFKRRDKITIEIIDEAFDEAQRDTLREVLENSDDTYVLFVLYTALLQKKYGGEVQVSEVYEYYRREAIGPLSFSYVSNFVLPKMEALGLVQTMVRGLGRGKGKARFIKIDGDLDTIIDICREIMYERYGRE